MTMRTVVQCDICKGADVKCIAVYTASSDQRGPQYVRDICIQCINMAGGPLAVVLAKEWSERYDPKKIDDD